MSTIDLFGFPVVVLRKVFSQFDLPEIFTISFCSKRTQENLQYVLLRNTISLRMCVYENSFRMECNRGSQSLKVETTGSVEPVDESEPIYIVNFDGNSFPVSVINRTLCVMGEENAFKAAVKYICGIFRSKIEGFLFSRMKSSYFAEVPFSRIPTWLIDWVMEQQDSVKSMCMISDGASEENISYIVSKVKVTEELHFILELADSEARILMRPMSLQRFESLKSAWLTMEILLCLDVEIARIRGSPLTSNDMNIFLKHWVRGGCGRLVEMDLKLGDWMDVDFNQVLEGIDFQRVEQKDANKYFSEYLSGFVGKDGGFKVRRKSDGKVALLLNDRQNSSLFNLLVDC